jgi:asparagine synthase (glutamine-hydrolysing)
MPYIAARLDNCTLMGASYGIDYRWPLWDVRLVQQYLSTPNIEKVGPRGVGRYLHRRAIDAVVPKRVAWKPSKDMGYGKVIQQGTTRLKALASDTERWLPELSPELAQLIDHSNLKRQLEQIKQGAGERDKNLSFFFRKQIGSLHRLHRWLAV